LRRWVLPVLLLILQAGGSIPAAGAADSLNSTPEERMVAVDTLFRQGGVDGAKGISAFLRDRDLAVRSHAMMRLVDLGNDAVDTLVDLLADEEVRWLASGALINIGEGAVRPTVLALHHSDPVVRRNALFILRQLDIRSAAPSIQETLNDPDPTVQAQAIQTVAQFGGPGAMRLILGKVESADPMIRDAAIGALPKFGEEAVPALASLLSYGNPYVRASAVRALGMMGSEEAMAFLRKSLSDASPSVRYYACLTLGESGEPSVIADIAPFFDDPDPDVREAVSEACARMPDAARPVLFRFLKEGTPTQKITAATAVRKARYRPALPLLLDMIRDPSREVKVSAVAALMTLADPDSVEGLVNGLGDPDIRWFCVMALRQLGEKNLKPLLRRTDDPELNYWKQQVLEGMGDRVLEGCLDTLATTKDEGTRIATVCTMRQIKDARAIGPLIRLMSDEKLGYVAGFVLSQMGEIAVEPLLMTLRDEDPVLRSRAATVLGEIGLAFVRDPLRELLNDRNDQVREAAERAIERIGRAGVEPSAAGTSRE